jgi:hypothetical protein
MGSNALLQGVLAVAQNETQPSGVPERMPAPTPVVSEIPVGRVPV